MIRRLFIIASSLSLMSFTATAALYGWSYHRCQHIEVTQGRHTFGITVESGIISLAWDTDYPPLRRLGWWESREVLQESLYHPNSPKFLGTEWFHRRSAVTRGAKVFPATTFRVLTIPLLAWALLFGLFSAPIISVRSQRRKRRRELGCCIRCGYDLRASKERCPECGSPIASKAGVNA